MIRTFKVSLYNFIARSSVPAVVWARRLVAGALLSLIFIGTLALEAFGAQCMTVQDMRRVAEVSGLAYAPPPPGGCSVWKLRPWVFRYPDGRWAAYNPLLDALEFMEGYEHLRWHEATHYLEHVAGVPYSNTRARRVQRELAIS